MQTQIVFTFLVMISAYSFAKWRKVSVEISMFLAALAGGIFGAFTKTPPINQLARHLVEGSFAYLDVILIFVTATIFMAIISESGGVNYVVKNTIKYFYNKRLIALLLLMFITLIPGALTGAGSVSLLVVGAPVALALGYLGIKRRKVAAILFIIAGLSAAAPPVNIWAMILSAGTAIPYVGFELPLGIPVLLLGTFTVLTLGWKKQEKSTLESALKQMPQVPKGMKWWRVLIPFLVFFGLVIALRVWPFTLPVIGLPFQFVISAVFALILSPKKINIVKLSRDTVKKLTPLLSTMVAVGMLQQIMTATGVRGLISYAVISTPLILLFVSLAVIIPVSEGVFTYGGAAIIGIPLVWFLDSIGLHATVAIAGLSLLWPLGDGLPPTALIGRLSVMVSEYKRSYWSFLKSTWIPWVVITVVGLLMVIFSTQLDFLVKWSL
ncbi:MAG: C4-dicarboxylate ABC transporter [Candidatus Aminicenantes bacterium]|nr:C4-dicarboxylate ABC transporter [Candidatus Aminicenantes bacterium]